MATPSKLVSWESQSADFERNKDRQGTKPSLLSGKKEKDISEEAYEERRKDHS
jgi:hypothetical protein